MKPNPLYPTLYLVCMLLLASPVTAQVTNNHGDPGISDANISFMDRGLRHYQDVLPITPTALGHHTLVNLAYGNLVHMREDVFIPGAGLPLRILFTYNSGSFFNGRFGYGWQLNYNVRYVTNSQDGSIIIVRPDDRTDLFVAEPDGSLSATYGVTDQLEALETGYKMTVYKDLFNNEGRYAEYFFESTDHHYVTRIVDQNGNALQFAYDDDKRLTTITDDAGRSLDLQYEDDQLVQITDPAGRVFTYTYTGEEMTQLTGPGGHSLTYTYTDGCHDLTSVTNGLGQEHVFQYNNDFALASVNDPAGQELYSFTYDWSPEGQTIVTDANGNLWVYSRDTQDRITSITDPMQHVITRTWNDSYKMVALVNADQQETTFGYDASGNMILMTNALGNSFRMHYDPVYQQMTSFENAVGGIEQFGYDDQGNLTSHTDVAGNAHQFVYDDRGLLTRITDPLGNQSQLVYDEFGNLIQTTHALGGTSTFTHNLIGKVTGVTDANGNQTQYSYDPLGRIIEIRDAMGGVQSIEYDAIGNMTSLIGKSGNRIEYAYDQLNRLTAKTDPLGFISTYTYDPMGNRLSYTDANGQEHQYVYNSLNQNTQITDPLGNQTTFGYNGTGFLTSLTDPNGQTTQLVYDEVNQLIQVIDALGGITGYEYDELGNQVARTDASGNRYENVFNDRSLCTQQTWPSGKSWTYGYDELGRLTNMTKPSGATEQFTYDELGRLVQSTYPEGTIQWSYDAVGNLTGIENGTSLQETTSYTYDALNRLITVNTNYGGFVGTQTLEYGYDAAGNHTSLTYPGGEEATFTYDAANRRTRVQSVDGTSEYTYDPAGNLTRIEYSNGMEALYQYDEAGRPRSLKVVDNGGVILIDRQYTFDPAGNKLTETHLEDNTSRTLVYDPLNRLIEATYSTGNQDEAHIYTYGPSGERLTKSINGSITQYVRNSDYLITREENPGGNTTYLYDEDGNRIKKTSPTHIYDYTYNSRDHLITCLRQEIADPVTDTREYQYSAIGQRAKVTDNGWPVFFTFAGKEAVVEQGNNWSINYNPRLALREDDVIAHPVYDHMGVSALEVWPEEGWMEPIHIVDFDEFGVKRKGSSEILTAVGSAIWDPVAQMLGGFGYDPSMNMISRQLNAKMSTQSSLFSSPLANLNTGAAYVNALQNRNPNMYHNLLPLFQQQPNNYYQQQQQVGSQLMNQTLTQRSSQLESDASKAFSSVTYGPITQIAPPKNIGVGEPTWVGSTAGSLGKLTAAAGTASISGGPSKFARKVDQGFTVLGDAAGIAETLGKCPGASWGVAAIQFIYQQVSGTGEKNMSGTIPLITPVGVFDMDQGYRESHRRHIMDMQFRGGV